MDVLGFFIASYFFLDLISQDKVYGWIIIGCISCLGSHGYCENFNSHFLFFYIFSVAKLSFFFFLFFFLIYHLFNFFQIKDGFVHMDFGLCAAGTQGLDFRKNTKKKSSAKKLHRTDSSPTAYDWFSILSLSYIYMYVCMYVCMLLSWHICTWLSSMVPTGLEIVQIFNPRLRFRDLVNLES